MIRVLLSVLFCFFALSTAAERFESTTIHRNGAWSVDLTVDNTDGVMWCTAKTTNRRSQTFSISAYKGGTLILYVFDHNWDIAPRPVRFLLDIDYSRWVIDGNADGFSLSLNLHDPVKAVKFIDELAQSNAVALYNTDVVRLATFSLRGSNASLLELIDCWKKIDTRDPFKNSKDPFG
ncbi:hypothetical protein IV417_13995 [Alphaproteobacteria bacterium KMM 3653]|uniref:Uncharacterized protein n=1 Tax=Harenicola maris TaxID=2841044 RepID=A0AAP2G526_9RHOB|nr:hypothetical protein [Harenicola maris]